MSLRKRLERLEGLVGRAPPSCQCLLVFCPQAGEREPPVNVVCAWCGRWRDPQTARLLEEIVVATREEAQAFLADPSRQE